MNDIGAAQPCWAFIWEPGQLHTALLALRLLAGLGAGYLAWLVLGPLVKVPYRLTQKKAMPKWGVVSSRLGGSFLVGLLVFSLLPVGIGGRGGPGLGSGPGEGGGGLGDGTSKRKQNGGNNLQAKKKIKGVNQADVGVKIGSQGQPFPQGSKEMPGRAVLPIQLLGGERYKGEGRFYLIQGKDPPRDLTGVEEVLQKVSDPLVRPAGVLPASLVGLLASAAGGPLLALSAAGPRRDIQVQIMLFPDSVDESHSAVQRLRELADRKYRFATMILKLP